MNHNQNFATGSRRGALTWMLVAGLLLGAASCGKKQPPAKPGPTKQLVLQMKGMTCGGCVKILTQSFKEVKGAKSVKVTLKPQRAVITYDSGAATPAAFVKAAEKKGYTATVQSDTLQSDMHQG